MIQIAAFLATALSLTSISWLGLASTPACFSESEFADVLLSGAPGLLREVGAKCSIALPHGMVLGNPASPLVKAADAASREAWPRTRPALLRVMAASGDKPGPSDIGMTLDAFNAGLAPMFAKIITRPESCASVDKMLKMVEPLPPKNLAAIMVELVRIVPSGKGIEFLCPAAG